MTNNNEFTSKSEAVDFDITPANDETFDDASSTLSDEENQTRESNPCSARWSQDQGPPLAQQQEETTTMQRLLKSVWADRRIGLAISGLLAALWGVLVGFWMPRGPLTTGQAMASIWISFVAFGVCGLVTRTLWTLLVAPFTFQFFLEVMRIRVDGPTVDKPQFSLYGAVAFAQGRGVQFLLSVVPMLVGISFGVAAAQKLSKTDPPCKKRWVRYTGFAVLIICALGILTLCVGLLIPARTDPIDDAQSVAELTWIEVNGHDLALMIRGQSILNPVLLFLAGGPGGSELGAMRKHLKELEENFTVVTWDQRGCGKSYVELDPVNTMSPDGFIDDALEVTDYLRIRFGQDRIFLLGQSWGTMLGILTIRESPERYAAYIGTGQMVSALATDLIMYNDTLTWARQTGHKELADQLVANGPPPYGSATISRYEPFSSTHVHDVYPYDHSMNSEGEGAFSENLNVKEYNLVQRLHVLAAFMDTYAALYPKIQKYDFRKDEGTRTFLIPVFFVQGAHEVRARSNIFHEWYSTIDAPVKDRIVLNTSGHRPLFEQPEQFVDYMVNTVLANKA